MIRRPSIQRLPARGHRPLATILVTDAEQRSCLAIVRSLARAGHDVHVCSRLAKPLSGASRFCRGSHRVPDPREDLDAFSAALLDVVARERVDLVVPVTDLSAHAVPAIRQADVGAQVVFAPYDAYSDISDKDLLLSVARELGIPVPTGVRVDRAPAGVPSLGVADGTIRFPAVVKPTRSVVPVGRGLASFGVRMVASEDELSTALAAYPTEAYPLLVQERVVGPGLGAFVLADRGRVVATFGHRRLRAKPPTGGVSVYRESVVLREDVRLHAERLVERFGWTGVAMVEFKEDAASGTPYLMEVNGRFWGSLQLAIDAGVDFPRLLLESVLGPAPAPVESYRLGVRSRWLMGDLDHLIWLLRTPGRARREHPDLPGRLRGLGRFLIPWRPGDRFEVLRITDPMPFARELASWLRGAARRPSPRG